MASGQNQVSDLSWSKQNNEQEYFNEQKQTKEVDVSNSHLSLPVLHWFRYVKVPFSFFLYLPETVSPSF